MNRRRIKLFMLFMVMIIAMFCNSNYSFATVDVSSASSPISVTSAETITGNATNKSVEINVTGGETITLDGVILSMPKGPVILVKSGSNLILEVTNDTILFATSTGATHAVIELEDNVQLTLRVKTGKELTIVSCLDGRRGADIGGSSNSDISNTNITIEGGGTINFDEDSESEDARMGAYIGSGYEGGIGNITINEVTITGGFNGVKSTKVGIGAGQGGRCGNITINGGTISGAITEGGIGGGRGRCSDITINGGTIYGPIGSGYDGTCGNITINGGSIYANVGGGRGQGGDITINGGTIYGSIGSGSYGTCGNITITGGSIYAKVNTDCAGIGSGSYGTCGNITITGGIICATGAGIGSGYRGTRGDITITGGDVDATKIGVYGNSTETVTINTGVNRTKTETGVRVYYSLSADGPWYGSESELQAITESTTQINTIYVKVYARVSSSSYKVNNITCSTSGMSDTNISSGLPSSNEAYKIFSTTVRKNYLFTVKADYKSFTRSFTLPITKCGEYGLIKPPYISGNTTVSGTQTGTLEILETTGATITLSGVTMSMANGPAISIKSGSNVILDIINDTTLDITSTSDTHAVIELEDNVQLTLKVSSGKILTVTNAGYGAGIGGAKSANISNTTITIVNGGGTITTKATYGAGIGSGQAGTIGNISITGGTVNVLSTYGEDIGAGQGGTVSGTVNTTGGTITHLVATFTIEYGLSTSGPWYASEETLKNNTYTTVQMTTMYIKTTAVTPNSNKPITSMSQSNLTSDGTYQVNTVNMYIICHTDASGSYTISATNSDGTRTTTVTVSHVGEYGLLPPAPSFGTVQYGRTSSGPWNSSESALRNEIDDLTKLSTIYIKVPATSEGNNITNIWSDSSNITRYSTSGLNSTSAYAIFYTSTNNTSGYVFKAKSQETSTKSVTISYINYMGTQTVPLPTITFKYSRTQNGTYYDNESSILGEIDDLTQVSTVYVKAIVTSSGNYSKNITDITCGTSGMTRDTTSGLNSKSAYAIFHTSTNKTYSITATVTGDVGYTKTETSNVAVSKKGSYGTNVVPSPTITFKYSLSQNGTYYDNESSILGGLDDLTEVPTVYVKAIVTSSGNYSRNITNITCGTSGMTRDTTSGLNSKSAYAIFHTTANNTYAITATAGKSTTNNVTVSKKGSVGTLTVPLPTITFKYALTKDGTYYDNESSILDETDDLTQVSTVYVKAIVTSSGNYSKNITGITCGTSGMTQDTTDGLNSQSAYSIFYTSTNKTYSITATVTGDAGHTKTQTANVTVSKKGSYGTQTVSVPVITFKYALTQDGTYYDNESDILGDTDDLTEVPSVYVKAIVTTSGEYSRNITDITCGTEGMTRDEITGTGTKSAEAIFHTTANNTYSITATAGKSKTQSVTISKKGSVGTLTVPKPTITFKYSLSQDGTYYDNESDILGDTDDLTEVPSVYVKAIVTTSGEYSRNITDITCGTEGMTRDEITGTGTKSAEAIFHTTANNTYAITATAGKSTTNNVTVSKKGSVGTKVVPLPSITLEYSLSTSGAWYASENALYQATEDIVTMSTIYVKATVTSSGANCKNITSVVGTGTGFTQSGSTSGTGTKSATAIFYRTSDGSGTITATVTGSTGHTKTNSGSVSLTRVGDEGYIKVKPPEVTVSCSINGGAYTDLIRKTYTASGNTLTPSTWTRTESKLTRRRGPVTIKIVSTDAKGIKEIIIDDSTWNKSGATSGNNTKEYIATSTAFLNTQVGYRVNSSCSTKKYTEGSFKLSDFIAQEVAIEYATSGDEVLGIKPYLKEGKTIIRLAITYGEEFLDKNGLIILSENTPGAETGINTVYEIDTGNVDTTKNGQYTIHFTNGAELTVQYEVDEDLVRITNLWLKDVEDTVQEITAIDLTNSGITEVKWDIEEPVDWNKESGTKRELHFKENYTQEEGTGAVVEEFGNNYIMGTTKPVNLEDRAVLIAKYNNEGNWQKGNKSYIYDGVEVLIANNVYGYMDIVENLGVLTEGEKTVTLKKVEDGIELKSMPTKYNDHISVTGVKNGNTITVSIAPSDYAKKEIKEIGVRATYLSGGMRQGTVKKVNTITEDTYTFNFNNMPSGVEYMVYYVTKNNSRFSVDVVNA